MQSKVSTSKIKQNIDRNRYLRKRFRRRTRSSNVLYRARKSPLVLVFLRIRSVEVSLTNELGVQDVVRQENTFSIGPLEGRGKQVHLGNDVRSTVDVDPISHTCDPTQKKMPMSIMCREHGTSDEKESKLTRKDV